MINYTERELKSKCMEILRQFDDVLKMIVNDEISKINSSAVNGEDSFQIVKKVFTNEGMKEGMRKILQKLNEYASKDV